MIVDSRHEKLCVLLQAGEKEKEFFEKKTQMHSHIVSSRRSDVNVKFNKSTISKVSQSGTQRGTIESPVTTLDADRKLIRHCRRRNSQNAHHGSIFHRLPLLCQTRGQKRKEAEKFELEYWPQRSKLTSWKVCCRREVTSGSTHPRLTSDWLAEIDLARNSGELIHSWFVCDKLQKEFETLDSEIARRIMKIKPAEFEREISVLELEAMEKTLFTRSSNKIQSSKSQSENIKESQEMPSVRLCRNLPRVTMF